MVKDVGRSGPGGVPVLVTKYARGVPSGFDEGDRREIRRVTPIMTEWCWVAWGISTHATR